LCHDLQAVRNEVVAADAAFLQREVERLSGELAEACSGAAETAALRAELAAATAAGSHLAEELAAAESAVRTTQARSLSANPIGVQHSSILRAQVSHGTATACVCVRQSCQGLAQPEQNTLAAIAVIKRFAPASLPAIQGARSVVVPFCVPLSYTSQRE
jgi:ribosome-binding ATPase YchF (GTP1/OBG family)